MKMEEQDLINTLKSIKSVQDVDDLEKLDGLVQHLDEFGASENSIRELLGVFERFPTEDAFDRRRAPA